MYFCIYQREPQTSITGYCWILVGAALIQADHSAISVEFPNVTDMFLTSVMTRGCLNPVTSAVRTSVDIGASAKLELVYKFCYLGDMLSVDGDADAAVEARIRIGWNKFRQLVPLLTNKDVSLPRSPWC